MSKMKMFVEICLLSIILFLIAVLIKSPKRIELYDTIYLSNVKNIDLSNTKIMSLDELNEKLIDFKKINTIDLGNNAFFNNDILILQKKYPNVNFKAVKKYNIYNKELKDNTENLDLSNVKIDKNIIEYLKLFSKLKSVNLMNQDLSLEEEIEIKKEFPDISFEWSVPILDIKVSSESTKISLDGKKVDNISNLYKSLTLLPKLTYLDMGKSNLSNEELDKIRKDFPNVKVAWVINFGVWHIRTDDVAFSVLISNFPYKRLTSEDIGFLKYCTDLKALDLGHQRITDLSPIADNLPELRILILADNKITDITPLKKLKKLHYLELFINNITDISPLKDNKELVDLNLCYNRINNYDVISSLPKLERLWVVGAHLNNEQYNKIISEHPNININRVGGGSTGNGWRTHSRYYAIIDMFHKRNYISEEFSKYD